MLTRELHRNNDKAIPAPFELSLTNYASRCTLHLRMTRAKLPILIKAWSYVFAGRLVGASRYFLRIVRERIKRSLRLSLIIVL